MKNKVLAEGEVLIPNEVRNKVLAEGEVLIPNEERNKVLAEGEVLILIISLKFFLNKMNTGLSLFYFFPAFHYPRSAGPAGKHSVLQAALILNFSIVINLQLITRNLSCFNIIV